jgi:hypothetical protein
MTNVVYLLKVLIYSDNLNTSILYGNSLRSLTVTSGSALVGNLSSV